MKVLIVKVSALGDIVHALPVLAWLHKASPGVSVDWLVEASFAPLLHGHPLLRNVLTMETKKWRKEGIWSAVGGTLGVVREIRREKYDLVLDLQGNSKSGLFTLMSGAGKRYGFDKQQVREWPNLLATNRKVAIPQQSHHISARYLQIAKEAVTEGVEVPLCGPLPVNEEAKQVVSEMLEEYSLAPGAFIVCHYGTTWPTKLWPLEQWKELVKQLVDDDVKIVLTWGNETEKAAVEAINAYSGGKASIWPRGTLPELVALLSLAHLVVGCDTGPVHIAAAVGTPTVSMYRVTDSERNGPPGGTHVRLQAVMTCSPCLKKQCNLDDECGRSIKVEQVYARICEFLN